MSTASERIAEVEIRDRFIDPNILPPGKTADDIPLEAWERIALARSKTPKADGVVIAPGVRAYNNTFAEAFDPNPGSLYRMDKDARDTLVAEALVQFTRQGLSKEHGHLGLIWRRVTGSVADIFGSMNRSPKELLRLSAIALHRI